MSHRPKARFRPAHVVGVAFTTTVLLTLGACSSSGSSGSNSTAATAPSSPSGSGITSQGRSSNLAISADPNASNGVSTGGIGTLNPEQATQIITSKLGPLAVQNGNTVRGINGKVITLCGVGTNTKAGQATVPGLSDGSKARIERANREGGVNGYTFNYVGFTDDTGLPGPAQQAVQDCVESKKAFALVPFVSASGVVGSYLNKNRVPYFGWLGSDYCGWKDKPYAFSIEGETLCPSSLPGNQTIGNTAQLTAYLTATGKKAADVTVYIYGTSDPFGVAAVNAAKAAAAGLGMKATTEADLPSATEPPLTDYSPIANKIMQSGTNLVMAETSPPAILGVTGALKSAGFTGQYLDALAVQQLLTNPATAQTIDGSYASLFYGSESFGADKLQQVAADLKAIGSPAPVDGEGTLTAYWSADLFLQALKAVNGPVTAEALANVLNQGGFIDKAIPGVSCGQTWPAGRVVTPLCSGLVQYDAASKQLVQRAALASRGAYVLSQ